MPFRAALATFAVVLTAPLAHAGELVVEGVHLCCGACVRDVVKVLPDAEVDRKAKTVSVAVENADGAAAALAKLTGAGFGGVAKFDGKALALPDAGVKKGAKADSVTFNGVHLCCGGCVKAAEKSLADLGDVSVDRKAKTVTVTGSGVDVSKAYAALVGAGFYGTVKK